MFLKVLLALAVASPVFAGEYAVLATGFRIHAERHEAEGSNIKLFTKDGVIEFPASSVASFESEEYVEPAPVVPTILSCGMSTLPCASTLPSRSAARAPSGK